MGFTALVVTTLNGAFAAEAHKEALERGNTPTLVYNTGDLWSFVVLPEGHGDPSIWRSRRQYLITWLKEKAREGRSVWWAEVEYGPLPRRANVVQTEKGFSQ